MFVFTVRCGRLTGVKVDGLEKLRSPRESLPVNPLGNCFSEWQILYWCETRSSKPNLECCGFPKSFRSNYRWPSFFVTSAFVSREG